MFEPGGVGPMMDEAGRTPSSPPNSRVPALRYDEAARTSATSVSDDAARTPVALVPDELVAFEAAARAVLRATRQADHWSAKSRRAALAVLDRVAGVQAVARARVLTAERDAGTWAVSGDRDLAAWLGRTSHEGRGAGFVAVRQAATLAAMPAVADAMADGPVTPAHVASLAKATSDSPLLAAELAKPEGQSHVVEMAQRLDATAFTKELARQAAALDPASRQREHDEQYGNRYLHVTHSRGGTQIKGSLDLVTGREVQLALEALTPVPSEDDPRDKGQHNADALKTMALRVLADPDTKPGAVVPTQVTLVVREETWAALRAPRSPQDDRSADGRDLAGEAGLAGQAEQSGSGAGLRASREPGAGSKADVVGRLRGVPPVIDEDGNVWPASEVARALCDCEFTRLVMGADGMPLDVGRAKRRFTKDQRKAVIARDRGGCTVPGCTMPARYTQLHHMRWWRRHGRTDIDNCCQLCVYHHGYVHDQDIRIERNRDGTYVFTYPSGRLMRGSALPDGAPHEEPSRSGIPNVESRGVGVGELVGDDLLLWTA